MTPEDKELMVLAARNAGYDIWWKTGICKGGPYESAFIGDTPWRPLEDDGDAFRLMADCMLNVFHSDDWVLVSGESSGCKESYDNKPRGIALRRAILLAASLETP